MIIKIKKTIRVTGNLSRHIVPLCVLLFAGCMHDDFFIPEGDDYVYDDQYSYDDFLKQQKFPPKSVYHPSYNRSTGPYEPNPPSRSWTPNDEPYSQPNHSNGQQGDNHPYRWSDHNTESIRTTTNNAAASDGLYNQPNHSSGWQGDNHHYWRSDHNAESIRTTTNNIAIRNKSNNHMSSAVLEEGCLICCDRDAYQDDKAVIQCLKCNQFICEPCHKRMKEKANEPHLHNYHNGFEFSCRTQFRCPYCKNPYE